MALRFVSRAIASKVPSRNSSTFALPPLKYEYDALEPHIDAKTMQIHHMRHHQTYISNLNSIVGGDHGSAIKGMQLTDIQKACDSLPPPIRTPTINHAGGHYNHCLFFTILKGAEDEGNLGPSGKLKESIDSEFGSFDAFKKQFDTAAIKHFGSGWAWASLDADGKLFISSTANQENPLMQGVVGQAGKPILGLDVWEHAYYLKNQNRRPEYVASFWNVVDWEQVGINYEAALQGKSAVFDVPMEE